MQLNVTTAKSLVTRAITMDTSHSALNFPEPHQTKYCLKNQDENLKYSICYRTNTAKYKICLEFLEIQSARNITVTKTK